MINRVAFKAFQRAYQAESKHRSVLLVEGARQVGKTTLIEQFLSSLDCPRTAINLEEQPILAQKIDACADFAAFADLVAHEIKFDYHRPGILFIDEAQESRQLGRFVRFMKEKWEWPWVILSGSSMARIFRDDVRYPVGRVNHLIVRPLVFSEFLLALEEKELAQTLAAFSPQKILSSVLHDKALEFFDQYLEVGGLPRVALDFARQFAWQETRQNLVYGYYQDFKRVFGETIQPYLIAGLAATSHLLGSPFKNTFVADFLNGASNQRIIEALGQLQAWHMVLLSSQKGLDAKEFFPKRYLFDAGIAKHLREKHIPSTRVLIKNKTRSVLGGLFENAVAETLLASGVTDELTGWKRSSTGTEIDFVIKRKSKVVPIECKASLAIKGTHLKGILDFMREYDADTGVIVSFAPFAERKIQNKRILVLPVYLLEGLEGML